MRHRAAEFFERHVLARHRLHHIGSGDEHVRGLAHHEDEVGHRWRIDGATGTGPEDDRDLRHDARRLHIASEDAAIGGKADHTFLNASARTVVQTDHRRTGR